MKRYSILGLVVLFLSLLPLGIADAAAVYSIDLKGINHNSAEALAHNTYCVDNTCDENEAIWAADVDVTDRPDPVAVDVCIFGDTDITFYSATITSTGSLYTGSYINDNTWSCGASSGTLGTVTTGTGWKCGLVTTDMLFCKMRIDENSNARITVSARIDAPQTECMDADHVTSPSNPPVYERFLQSDVYKHSDTTKSDTDSLTQDIGCLDGNMSNAASNLHSPWNTHQIVLYPNGTSPTRFKPTATPFKMADVVIHDYTNGGGGSMDIAGSLTYSYTLALPTYVTATSCAVTGTFPHGTPTCSVWASGKKISFTVNEGGAASITGYVSINGTIGTPTGCPFGGTQVKDFFTDQFVTRVTDGAWNLWGAGSATFGCS